MKSKWINFIFFIFLTVFMLSDACAAENGAKKDQVSVYKDLFEGFVYFADEHKTALTSVNLKFASTLDSHALGREIIKTLLAGPSAPSVEPIWPEDVSLTAFFITDDGKAYVDLKIDQGMLKNMDAGLELLAIYSMVNSLTLNIPKIKKVKLLIQGRDALTLAGHIDLDTFYQTNMLIVK